ncbi:single-stranded DNA-binding protein [Stenotrophomonas maltophilia]|uniref:single-stranded DNA-binding protein n=1 Tax=Stenotrophomonas maltophilia TaxID=40324 RepID=UPI0015F23C02|nr:single-stranded DNA-binding protein [Stenotrophomonas maltophilia]QDY48757.1 single-stranded DNA-binding protein [Stenotrophomonas maltophilia]
MNNFSAVGRIGRDAVTRFTQAGKAVTGWALAVDRGFGDNKQTVWLDCTLWGDRGQKLAEHIRKGDRLGVVGEIGTREHDGKTYVTLDVKDVTLLGGKQEGQSGGTSSRRGGQDQRERPQRATDNAQQNEFADDDIPFVRMQGGW